MRVKHLMNETKIEQGVISCYSISEGVYKEIGFNDGVSHNGGVANDSSTKCAVAL